MPPLTQKNFYPAAFFLKWEWLLFFIFIIFNVIMVLTTPYYLDIKNIFDMTFIFTEKGLVALVMTFIIITGNIDISVASIMGLSSVSMAVIFESGVNIWISVLCGILVGTACGLFNGLIITRVKLPSIIITLATFSFYRV
jgi:rhamnose transport system permease protein